MKEQFAQMYPTLTNKDIDKLVRIEQVLKRSKSRYRTDFSQAIEPAVTMVSTLPRVEDSVCEACE